jgi:outer membrane protein OmpA-like peptidoglycan-associated protein
MRLSQRRAETSRDYLIAWYSNNRLTAQGYGESHLVNKCSDGTKCSESEHQANRGGIYYR